MKHLRQNNAVRLVALLLVIYGALIAPVSMAIDELGSLSNSSSVLDVHAHHHGHHHSGHDHSQESESGHHATILCVLCVDGIAATEAVAITYDFSDRFKNPLFDVLSDESELDDARHHYTARGPPAF